MQHSPQMNIMMSSSLSTPRRYFGPVPPRLSPLSPSLSRLYSPPPLSLHLTPSLRAQFPVGVSTLQPTKHIRHLRYRQVVVRTRCSCCCVDNMLKATLQSDLEASNPINTRMRRHPFCRFTRSTHAPSSSCKKYITQA